MAGSSGSPTSMAGLSKRSWSEHPSPDPPIYGNRPGLNQTPGESPRRIHTRDRGDSSLAPRVTGEKPRRRRPSPRHRSLTGHPTTIPPRKSWPCPFADLPATAPSQLGPPPRQAIFLGNPRRAEAPDGRRPHPPGAYGRGTDGTPIVPEILPHSIRYTLFPGCGPRRTRTTA